MTVFIGDKHLLTILCHLPLAVTLLFGHIHTHWHVLHLSENLHWTRDTLLRCELIDNNIVIVHSLSGGYLLTVSVANNLATVHWDILTDLLPSLDTS